MGFLVGLAIGAVGASVAWWFIYRNNKVKIGKVLNMDPKVAAKKALDDLLESIKAKIG